MMGDSHNLESQVDTVRWNALAGSLGSALTEIVATYLADTPGKIEGISQAIAGCDYGTVQRLVHSLKSSSGIFGANRMVTFCKDLEQAAYHHQPALGSWIDPMKQVYQDLEVELKSRIADLGGR
jgi:HPt (histidine-containing phosphotransfer) domain-containing protein